MKYILLTTLMILSIPAFSATKVECNGDKYKFQIVSYSASDIEITYSGETVRADGYLDQAEVDLVARFKSIGEMTLFAKRGKTSPESYLFTGGRRITVYCN
jgi:hypothetical protein